MSKGIAVRAVLLTGAIIIAFALGAALALRGMLPAIPGATGKALQESPAAAKAKAAPAPVKPGPKKKPQEQRRPGEPAPYYGDLNSLAAVNVRDASLDTIAKGLQYPWAMEILSSTEALVT
ncbi:MAG: glucose/arabinose dehydrogenase [Haliea salexigens]|jgi:glucose/arabinose dehydrogenase|nr:hypothetical protein [Haliea sp.]MBP68988.1 hypothetical protein [Haliea sp.]HCD56517.1 hypothetical protein [Halieaceae bacterium]|tara:strand:+ start:8312 stop:8674 length:363 start_codon:yes stop_codon:yes gene_type:complete